MANKREIYKDEITFKRRKVLRLIRKFNRECEYIKPENGFSYVQSKIHPYKYIA